LLAGELRIADSRIFAERMLVMLHERINAFRSADLLDEESKRAIDEALVNPAPPDASGRATSLS